MLWQMTSTTPVLGLNYFHAGPILFTIKHRQHLRNVQHMQIMDRMTDTVIFVKVSLNSHTCTHLFNGPLSGTTWMSQYQNGKTNVDFIEARDSEWQWHQLGHMQVCTSLQTDNHACTPPLSFLQAGCPSCRPTNSVKALKALSLKSVHWQYYYTHTSGLKCKNSHYSHAYVWQQ